MAELAEKHRIGYEEYPLLKTVFRIKKLERKVDFDSVTQEVSALVSQIQKHLSYNLQQLMAL